MSSRALRLCSYCFAAAVAFPAMADEQMVPIAVGGEWVAAIHQESSIAPPDVCMVYNARKGFGLRADADGIQARVGDNTWSLPAGVTGTLAISVGDQNDAFDIGGNTSTMVASELDSAAAVNLLDAMDKASALTFTVGKAKPVVVSLTGSTIATNAFRTCASLRGSKAAPGVNPFD